VALCMDGKATSRYVHELVLEAFIGPRPRGHQCCHRDGDGLNNSVENLRWDTRAGNHHDRIEHGTDNRGEKHSMAKLCSLDVWLIRSISATNKELAEFFGVSSSNIRAIKRRKSWRHLHVH